MHPLLPRVPILTGLSDAAMKLLSKESMRSVLPAKTIVVREGESGISLYMIESGAVRVLKNCGKPEEFELAILKAGDFFGEGCILDALPRGATVQTTAVSVLHSLPAIGFYHLYEAMPAQHSILLLNIARDLSRRLRRLDEIFAGCH